MNQRELSEIRRRIHPGRNSMTHIYGCYVNGVREIISCIDESLGLLSKEESEMYMELLRKGLSGALGRNLISVDFATKQVADSDEHRLLSALRKSTLEDEQLRDRLYRRIIDSLSFDEDCNYLILLACDAYDVARKGRDGLDGDNTEVFKYILCCVCPVKSKGSELKYSPEQRRFLNSAMNQIVCSPELGFMFPAFDDRTANIYSALFYTRNTEEVNQAFIDGIFHTPTPMAAGQQRDSFHTALAETLDTQCSFEVVQSVHEQLSELISAHKESRSPEALTISVDDMGALLENSGTAPEQADAFRKKCAEEFGGDAMVSPQNLIGSKNIEICTPEVKISVEPQYGYLVQTKRIDGRNFILIAADGGVEINGVNVNFPTP